MCKQVLHKVIAPSGSRRSETNYLGCANRLTYQVRIIAGLSG